MAVVSFPSFEDIILLWSAYSCQQEICQFSGCFFVDDMTLLSNCLGEGGILFVVEIFKYLKTERIVQ